MILTWLRSRIARIVEWWGSEEVAEAKSQPELDVPAPRAETVKYLSELAQGSYERQSELTESVWRSLPFFAAALALAVTLIGRVAENVPALSGDPWAAAANILLWLSIAAFVWTLRWFWEVIAPRTHVYPADDADVWEYARGLTEYYSASGSRDEELDQLVLNELRALVAHQFGDAARANLSNNLAMLKARSQLLLFVMIGFVLVILAQGITYGRSVVTSAMGNESNAQAQPKSADGRPTRGQQQINGASHSPDPPKVPPDR